MCWITWWRWSYGMSILINKRFASNLLQTIEVAWHVEGNKANRLTWCYEVIRMECRVNRNCRKLCWRTLLLKWRTIKYCSPWDCSIMPVAGGILLLMTWRKCHRYAWKYSRIDARYWKSKYPVATIFVALFLFIHKGVKRISGTKRSLRDSTRMKIFFKKILNSPKKPDIWGIHDGMQRKMPSVRKWAINAQLARAYDALDCGQSIRCKQSVA